MILVVSSILEGHPQYGLAALFAALGVFLILSVVWCDATGEMSQESAFSGCELITRQNNPKKFQVMLNSCVIGAITCFGCAGFFALFF